VSHARLYYAYGYEVGVGQAYGRPQYGLIGFGVGLSPGFPLFSAPFLSEISDEVTAIVVHEPYGSVMYGSFLVRQARAPGPIPVFSIDVEATFSPEFVEDELLEVSLRVSENETVCFEWDEVVWPG
jgi:hypothetical protein